MKKFMLLIAALLLPLQAFAITQSTYSVVISSVGYEGDLLKVTTQNNLSTGCAVNDESNTFWVQPSVVQKVVAGITMSAHQDRRQAILYYDYNSCDEDGVTVIGAAIKAEKAVPQEGGVEATNYAPQYDLLEVKELNNLEPYRNMTDSSIRVIFTGIDAEVRSDNTKCDYSFILTDSSANHTIKSTNVDVGQCNIAQTSFNLAPNMTVKFQDHLFEGTKAQILVFGVKQ